jgi:phosphoribosylformimino-5-aminoimidazole carboxamide ribotide isomerase
VILGLESFDSPESLADVASTLNRDIVTFSLDLKHGQPIADAAIWPSNLIEIVDFVDNCGIDHLIILDLAAVGMRSGLVTGDVCRQVRARHPAATIITGGGIRSEAEVESALACGANLVLMATALHDGGLTPATSHAS